MSSLQRSSWHWTVCSVLSFILSGSPALGAELNEGLETLSQDPAGRVENIRFDLAEGGVVRVFYDLIADNPQQLLGVRLVVSQDGGQTFDITAASVSGDVGPTVVPGAGKRITWEAARDIERLDTDRLRFRIEITIIAAGQRPPRSWGVSASFVPDWRLSSALSNAFFNSERANWRASEFRVGMARGRSQGAEWGITLVRKRLKAGSSLVRVDASDPGTSTTTLSVASESPWLTGAEMYAFMPFVRLGNRSQLGVLLGGGMSTQFEGTVQRRTEGPIFTTPAGGPSARIVSVGPGFMRDYRGRILDVQPGETAVVEQVTARELYSITGNTTLQPLVRAELAATFSVRRQLKLRVSGGFNFPGFQVFSVEIAHLFGVPGTGR